MAYRVKKHLDVLRVLKSAKPKLRSSILKAAEKELIQCLSECSHNVLAGNIKLSPKQRQALCKHRKSLRDLGRKQTKVDRKRKILIQKGGFLPALLTPILAIAGSLIGELVRK